MLTIDQLREKNLIIFECISGSRAYGLHTPQSDTDIKGVFILPEEDFFGLSYVEQVNNETNDVVFYELKRFMDLLNKSNPNLLELLSVPDDCIIHKDPLFEPVQPALFLSRQCKQTFANYAMAQIKKAKGLNKKISKPMSRERKSILDFCYVPVGQGSVSIKEWLVKKGLQQERCGLVNLPHMRDIYSVFYDREGDLGYKGIAPKDTSNEVSVSSVPKGEEAIAFMSFNRDGYSAYCKEYKEYWDWVDKRNDARYQNTVEHGKNYDAKNMMHVFRLLNMAEEIALHKEVITRRPDREYLLRIRSGEFMYEDLVAQAEEKIQRIESLYEQSDLPGFPDSGRIERLLVSMRREWYKRERQK